MRPLIPGAVDESVLEGVETARRNAARLGRPVFVTWVAKAEEGPELLRFFHARSAQGETSLYFSTPGRELRLAGAGSVATIRPAGADRFRSAASEWRSLVEGHVCIASGDDPPPPPCALLAMGGFSFFDQPILGDWGLWSPFGEGLLVVPEECLVEYQGVRWRIRTALVRPGDDLETVPPLLSGTKEKLTSAPRASDAKPTSLKVVEDPARYRRAIASAVEAIRSGDFSKVVLARSTFVPGAYPPWGVLEHLDLAHPHAYVYGFNFGEVTFLGATPERLLSLRDGRLTTMALAGSAPRGETPERDEGLGAELLASAKNQGEHRIVLDYLVEALTPVCRRIEAAGKPELLRLPNVQHLLTPVQGELSVDLSLLELLERVHPTPAVGGFPKERALEYLRTQEGIERGWYAGPVGWIDAAGDGEFAVALRSALLAPGGATLFAGCGVVATSDPEEELHEARLKAKPMLEALERSTP